MVLHSRTVAHPRQPEVKDTWLAEAGDHTDPMNAERNQQHPPRTKDKKQFDRDDRINDEESISDARKHLWPCQRYKQRVSAKFVTQVALQGCFTTRKFVTLTLQRN